MIIDTSLEQHPATVVVGPSINPVAPSVYTGQLCADGLHTFLVGAAYAGALWKIVRATLPNSGKVALTFDWLPDATIFENAQACEFDTRVTDADGYTYELDLQLNLATSRLQVALNGSWTDAGSLPDLETIAHLPISVEIQYFFDVVEKKGSILSISFGGAPPQLISSAFQDQSAKQLGWEPNQVVLQKQLDLKGAGGAMMDVMRDISYEWG